ncbi:3-oxoacyl-[acyl-carrier-protein] reductase FabG-like [Anneissia japonica]|uniref:3-oxoacyl-[acyl-carrier-protein] reductase FabG-like n=1 Tax=Anneissia japonica TaxID=1529436 RepID=UPI001425B06B|nr:3-oxoacyl-[acyl-carrier-protein] reductase FabG-like [Anneissia japonica]
MNFLFEKVAIITGASSGIGAGTAVHFATLGCSLALVGRNMEGLKKVAAECEERGLEADQILLVNTDVTREHQVESAVAEVINKFHKIDIVVNSAGCLTYGGLESTSEVFDDVFQINVKSIFTVCKAVEPHVSKSKGVIINVSSACSLRASPGLMIYGMSKAAVDHMTKTLALELAPKQVRVNAVNPGIIRTPIYEKTNTPWETTEEKMSIEGKKWHPLGRVGQVDDVAKAIAFLASDEGGFITGETLPVDGGRHISLPAM